MEEHTYPYKIEINGARTDSDQYWRIHRIYMVIGYAQAIADLDENESFYKKIERIYDDKGRLSISWYSKPSKEEKEYLLKAWESIVTDYEGNAIDHDIISQ